MELHKPFVKWGGRISGKNLRPAIFLKFRAANRRTAEWQAESSTRCPARTYGNLEKRAQSVDFHPAYPAAPRNPFPGKHLRRAEAQTQYIYVDNR
jgi:hypothetical protein